MEVRGTARRACVQCGTGFEVSLGKGGKAALCSGCQLEHRRQLTSIRGQRHALAQMTELVETIGPAIYSWKKEVCERQRGICESCCRERRLYLAAREDGELYGLCLACFEAWVSAKRRRHHDDDPD